MSYPIKENKGKLTPLALYNYSGKQSNMSIKVVEFLSYFSFILQIERARVTKVSCWRLLGETWSHKDIVSSVPDCFVGNREKGNFLLRSIISNFSVPYQIVIGQAMISYQFNFLFLSISIKTKGLNNRKGAFHPASFFFFSYNYSRVKRQRVC